MAYACHPVSPQVEVANVVEDTAEKVHDLESAHTLATQKRLRLDGAIAAQHAEIRKLRNAIDLMHNDMTRLNTLISKNEAAAKRLAESNFSKEKDFMVELQEMEKESVRLEAQIATLKEEKAKLLEDILEAERQVMLWEKKIALEKETQAALDPSVGMSEAAAMEREIHRMRLRYESLQRDQARLVQEMERAIEKRESIELRFVGRSKVCCWLVGWLVGILGSVLLLLLLLLLLILTPASLPPVSTVYRLAPAHR